MAAALTISAASVLQDNSQRIQRFYCTGTIAGAYVSGGMPLNSVLTAALQPQATNPKRVTICSRTGSGYVYLWNVANSTLQILEVGPSGSPSELAGGPLVEIPAGTVPAAVSSDVLDILAEFNRNVS